MPIIEKKFSKPAENSDSLRSQIKEFDISYLQVTVSYFLIFDNLKKDFYTKLYFIKIKALFYLIKNK